MNRRLPCLAAGVAAITFLGAGPLQAQVTSASIAVDARTHLKAGWSDAGMAASNMELITHLPIPPGFFDETWKPGQPPPPSTPRAPGAPPREPGAPVGGGPTQMVAYSVARAAFSGDRMVVGGFHGFHIYELHDKDHPRLISSVVCPGGQGEVSIHQNLVFFSTEERRARLDCGAGGVADEEEVSAERFQGVRIFDISDPLKVRQVAAVQTCRGSHTNTPIPDPADPRTLYIYSQGLAPPRSADELAGCSDKKPSEDPNTSLYSIDIIKVPLDAPEKAAVIARPRLFADPTTGAIDGLWKGGGHGPDTRETRVTDHCHDITAFPAIGLAAGGCSGNGILFDIRDPQKPVRLAEMIDPNFTYWHVALFSNDGKKLVFTDEWSSGVFPRCRAQDSPNWGGDVIVDIVDGRLEPRAYYKLPSIQADHENCTAHNLSLIPVPGRDIAVQGWYGGGTSVFDFTDSAHPFEIAYFDRGPIDPKVNYISGHWGAYWHNGRIYASDIARGVDVLKLKPSEQLTANEIAAAELITSSEYNPPVQSKIAWPDHPVVARAYLDQLAREHALPSSKVAQITKALDRSAWRNAALVKELSRLAQAASGRTAERLSAVARMLRGGA